MRPALMTTLLAAVALGPLGCTQRATITRLDGETIDGVIVGADADRIYVDVDSREPGREIGAPGVVGVPRDRIREIDHPGGGHIAGGVTLIIGGVVAVAGGLFATAIGQGRYDTPGVGPEAIAVPMLAGSALAAGGAWMIARSGEVEERSRRAARGRADQGPRQVSEPLTIHVSTKSVVFDLDLEGGFGGGIGVGLPIDDIWRVEPAVEVDAYLDDALVVIKAPVRLGLSFTVDGDYRLDVMPEVGLALSVPLDDPDTLVQGVSRPDYYDPLPGLSLGLMIGHRFRIGHDFELELAHGFSVTRFAGEASRPDPSTAMKDGRFDAFVLRLGARFTP